MNICLISQEYPPETNWGGIATYTQVLARQLVQMGHRVHVVALAEGEEKTADDCGAVVHRVSRVPKAPFDPSKLDELGGLNHGLLYFSQRVYEEVREIHEKEPLDVIEAPETCAQALLVFKRIQGVKKITRCHTPFFWVRHLNAMDETPDHLTRDALEKLQTEWSTAVTSPTFAMAEVVKNKWGIDSIVIPNFFNLKTYTPDTSIYEKHCAGTDYFLFYGRLEYRKGVHVLAAALPGILERHKDVRAVFVGSDSVYNARSMKAYMQEQIAGYEKRVTFIDNIPHAALYPMIAKARFVVLPSLWENFPYACMEGMSLGKTVVASDSGGFPEIIDNGKEGILCEPGDVAALTSAITTCLDSVDVDAIGENARKKAEVYDTEKVVEEMASFYRTVSSREGEGAGKIAYIVRHMPVPSETFVINEIIALQAQGVEVYPVSLLPAQVCHEALMARVEKEILDLAGPDCEKRAEKIASYERARQYAKEYKIPAILAAQAAITAEYVTDNGIGHLHAHFATESAWVALITSKLTGVPFSFTAHAYDIFMRDRKCIDEESLEERLSILLANCAKCITISDYNRLYIAEHSDRKYLDKIEVVHCGIDIATFRPVARPERKSTTFISVGRFVEKKGFEYLIRAFATVAATLNDVTLRIIGEGHFREPMMELADELGLGEKITFLGAVSSEVVLQEMTAADVFVLHSVTGANGDREGIPVSLMEACATGMPVLSTRHSGIPELVLEGVSGFLSEEKDVEGFANYMIALATSPALRQRMGAAGHRHVSRHFNQQQEVDKLCAGFRRLMSAPLVTEEAAGDAVDIIMPTYRPNLFLLKRAVESIVGQSYRNWNLYLVQDGEDTDLGEFLRKFDDPRIHYFAIPHSGKPAALNFALGKGNSRYIAYLDDDDIWYPNHLEAAISYMSENGVKLLHTDAHEIDVTIEGERLVESSRKNLNKGVLTDKTMWYVSHINVLHERSLLSEAGCYDESKRFFIDWDMLQRLARLAKPHHLKMYTCEHYNFANKQSKNISLVHKEDPELSQMQHKDMFKRAFALLSPDDFVDIVDEHQSLLYHLDLLKQQLKSAEKGNAVVPSAAEAPKDRSEELHAAQARIGELNELLARKESHIADLYNSLSWRITQPLRAIYSMLLNK